MIKNKFKLSLLATAMICAAGVSGVSSAHDTVGVLGTSISNIDVYHTSCFNWSAAAVAVGGLRAGQSTANTLRFAGRVAKVCTGVSPAACAAQAGTLRISVGAKDSAAVAAGATATATLTTGGALRGETLTYAATPSSWAQVANNGPAANKNGDYLVAVGHESTVANNYWVQFHCENIAVGALPLPSDVNNGVHTGTGVTATGGTITAPTDNATGLDFNQFINQ